MNPTRRRYERSDPDRIALATNHARTAPLRRAKRKHTIVNCARISIQPDHSHRIESETPCLSESSNARSACWSVRWSAHRERCGAGPSEFQEAYRKGPIHAPVSTSMHVMLVHSWQSHEATRAWRPWGGQNVHTRSPNRELARKTPCMREISSLLMTVGETDRRGELVQQMLH